MKRREFVKNVAAAASVVLIAPKALHSQSSTASKIEILINEPIGAIHKDIYGHFVEHLGGVVYDGIWVGEKSKIPNYKGVRKALVDNLKKLNPGVIRYPGAWYADQYDWRYGIGA